MVLMILSKREVRSAWKAFHCRQQRKMTIAASGRPLWKPTSPASHPKTRSVPCQRMLCSNCVGHIRSISRTAAHGTRKELEQVTTAVRLKSAALRLGERKHTSALCRRKLAKVLRLLY